MDTATTATIASAITGVLAVLLTKGVDALLRYRKSQREDCEIEDDRADKSYKWVNAQQEKRIIHLEAEIVALRKLRDEDLANTVKRELECQAAQEALRVQVQELRWQLNHTKSN